MERSFRNDVLPLKNELFRLALRIIGDRAEAEDVVQETMIKIWNRRDQWDSIQRMDTYCLAVCRNIALDKLGDKQRRDVHNAIIYGEITNHELVSNSANPVQQIVRRDQIELIRRIINSLPEKQRSAILLRDIEQKSYKEIADILSISEDYVKVNIHRARQTVKKRFMEVENYGL